MYNMFERVINRWVVGSRDLVMRFKFRGSIYSEAVSSSKFILRSVIRFLDMLSTLWASVPRMRLLYHI